MNQNQITQVKGHLDEFSSIDLSNEVASKYGDNADLASIAIGEYTAREYVSLVRKVFSQFNEEISTVYVKALPFQYNYQNEYGNGNLNQDLAGILNHIKGKNLAASVAHLNRLIHYQAVNGFWEKSKRKYFRSSEISVQEDKDRIDLVSKHMEKVSDRLDNLVSSVDEQKNEINRFLISKKSELSEIESLLAAARQHSNEINEIYTKSATLEEKIISILNQSEQKKDSAYKLNNEIEKLLSELSEIIQKNKESLESQHKVYESLASSFKNKLELVESKQEYFEERNKYLDDLIGREVGASLFETFKQRKKELVSSIGFWKWSVPITAVVAVLWIFFLFGNGDLSNLSWQAVLVNSLKALPAVGLLLFSISQYSKERNFQEEYAFKSAVALTVNSYADQLSEDSNKDKMIMESVSQIYRSPIYHKLKSKEESKSFSTTVSELTDGVKSNSITK